MTKGLFSPLQRLSTAAEIKPQASSTDGDLSPVRDMIWNSVVVALCSTLLDCAFGRGERNKMETIFVANVTLLLNVTQLDLSLEHISKVYSVPNKEIKELFPRGLSKHFIALVSNY